MSVATENLMTYKKRKACWLTKMSCSLKRAEKWDESKNLSRLDQVEFLKRRGKCSKISCLIMLSIDSKSFSIFKYENLRKL